MNQAGHEDGRTVADDGDEVVGFLRPAGPGQTDPDRRTWQLVMTCHGGLEHVTREVQADMARLLDLDPSVSHLTLEVGEHRIHIARDWPSGRMEEADMLLGRILGSGNVSAIVVHDRAGSPPRRIAADD